MQNLFPCGILVLYCQRSLAEKSWRKLCLSDTPLNLFMNVRDANSDLSSFFFIWIFVDCTFQYFLERRNIWWQDVLSRILFAIVICWISARMEFSFPFFFSFFLGYLWIAQCNSLWLSFIHRPLYKTQGTCWLPCCAPKRRRFGAVLNTVRPESLFTLRLTDSI